MIKIASLKEIRLSAASPGHLLLFRRLGEKFVILVHGPQQQAPAAVGLITLTGGTSPALHWLQPQALDTPVVDLGPCEFVLVPKLEEFSSGTQHHAPGAMIIETEGPALICKDLSNGMDARIGIANWRLRTGPVQGSNFYIREWQLGVAAVDDNKFDVVYAQRLQAAS
jgi:hypothetical protein